MGRLLHIGGQQIGHWIGEILLCKSPQQTKCECCVEHFLSISAQDPWSVNRNEIVTITDDIWPEEMECIDQVELPFQFTPNSISFRLPSISLHLPWTIFKIRHWLKGKFHFHFWPVYSIDCEGGSGSKTIKACGWNERKWPEANWDSEASNAPQMPSNWNPHIPQHSPPQWWKISNLLKYSNTNALYCNALV